MPDSGCRKSEMLFFICDDESLFLEEFSKQIAELKPRAQIRCFINGEVMIAAMKAPNEQPCAAFIDIRLGDTNGIDLAAKIANDFPNVKLIFITAFGNEYFEEIFLSVKPFAILRKPINADNLSAHLTALEEAFLIESAVLSVKKKGIIIEIPFSQIMFLESEKRQIHIHTVDDSDIDVYEKINDILDRLGDRFIHCQKSYIVNADKVSRMTPQAFILTDGRAINISATYREQCRKQYFKIKGKID